MNPAPPDCAGSILSVEERAVALARYQTDRAHEPERAASAFEQAFLKGLLALNGRAAAAFIALQGRDMFRFAASPHRAWAALA